jgi:hypothetical protein
MQNNQSLQLLNADSKEINDALYINEAIPFTKAAKKEKRKKAIDSKVGKIEIPKARKAIKELLTIKKKSPWTPEIIDNTLNESTFIKEVLNNTELIGNLKRAILKNDKKEIANIISANALQTSFLNKDITTLLGKKSGNSKSSKATQGKINRELEVEASFKNQNLNFLLEDDGSDDEEKVDPFHNFIDEYLNKEIFYFYNKLKKYVSDSEYLNISTDLFDKIKQIASKNDSEKLGYMRKICLNDRDTIDKDPFITYIKELSEKYTKIEEENIIYYYLAILSSNEDINSSKTFFALLPYIFIKSLNKDKQDSVLSYKNVKAYDKRVKEIDKLFSVNVKAGYKAYKKIIKDIEEIKNKQDDETETGTLSKLDNAKLYEYLALITHSRIQQKFYGVVENNIRNFKDQMKLEMQNDPKKKEEAEMGIIKKAAVGYLTISYGVPLAMAAMGPLGWVAGPAVLAIFGGGTSMLMKNMTGSNLSKLVKGMSPEAKLIGPQIYKKVRSETMYENSFNRKGQLITEAVSGDDVLKKIRNVLKTKNLLHFKFELNKNFSKFDSLFLSNMGAIINEYFGLETSKKEKDDQNVEGSEKSEFNAANKLIRVCAAQAQDFVKNDDGKFEIDGKKECDKAKFAKLINEIPVESRVPLFFKYIEVATSPEATDFTWKFVFAKLKLRDNSSVMNVVKTSGFDKDKEEESQEES